MTAEEARKLSSLGFKQKITSLNKTVEEEVKNKASDGKYSAVILTNPYSPQVVESVAKSLKEEGYKVDVSKTGIDKYLNVEWELKITSDNNESLN